MNYHHSQQGHIIFVNCDNCLKSLFVALLLLKMKSNIKNLPAPGFRIKDLGNLKYFLLIELSNLRVIAIFQQLDILDLLKETRTHILCPFPFEAYLIYL